MHQSQIFSPVFVMLFLTSSVWVYMYAKRIPFIRSLQMEPDELTPAELLRLAPPSVMTPSDNLKNLFEVPIVFYILAFYLYLTNQVDTFYLWMSWLFVIFRVLHSVVHCTVNTAMVRFWLYGVSCLSVFIILMRAAYHVFFRA